MSRKVHPKDAAADSGAPVITAARIVVQSSQQSPVSPSGSQGSGSVALSAARRPSQDLPRPPSGAAPKLTMRELCRRCSRRAWEIAVSVSIFCGNELLDFLYFQISAIRHAHDLDNEPDPELPRAERRRQMLRKVTRRGKGAAAFTVLPKVSVFHELPPNPLDYSYEVKILPCRTKQHLQEAKQFCKDNGYAGFTRMSGLAYFFMESKHKLRTKQYRLAGADTYLYVGFEELQGKAIMDRGDQDPSSNKNLVVAHRYRMNINQCKQICRNSQYVGFVLVDQPKGPPKACFYGKKAMAALGQGGDNPNQGVGIKMCPGCTLYLNVSLLDDKLAVKASGGSRGDASMGWGGPSKARMSGKAAWSTGEQLEDEESVDTQFAPIFTGLQSLVCFGLYVFFYLKDGTEVAGLDSLWPDRDTQLLVHDDCDHVGGWLIARILAHQFTHVSWMHVISNCGAMLFFGFSMEGHHGHLLLLFMFELGVLGGACGFFADQVHSSMVGMSGGVYALFGMHFGDLAMNLDTLRERHQKENARKPPGQRVWSQQQLFQLLSAAIIPVYMGAEWWIMVRSDTDPTQPNVNDAAHLGGFIAGLCAGIVFGKNTRPTDGEQVVRAIAFVLGIVLLLWCTYFAVSWPPRTVFDPVRWCWARALRIPGMWGDDWKCVRCDGSACIERWLNMTAQCAGGTGGCGVMEVTPNLCTSLYGGWQPSDAVLR